MRVLFCILLTPLLVFADEGEFIDDEAALDELAAEQELNLPDPFSPEFVLPFETPNPTPAPHIEGTPAPTVSIVASTPAASSIGQKNDGELQKQMAVPTPVPQTIQPRLAPSRNSPSDANDKETQQGDGGFGALLGE